MQKYGCYDKLKVNSRCNEMEAEEVVRVALWVRKVLPLADIRIFTNYTNQVSESADCRACEQVHNISLSICSRPCASNFSAKLLLLQELLENKQAADAVPVQSITASQGAECDVAILSTVVAHADTGSGVRRFVVAGSGAVGEKCSSAGIASRTLFAGLHLARRQGSSGCFRAALDCHISPSSCSLDWSPPPTTL